MFYCKKCKELVSFEWVVLHNDHCASVIELEHEALMAAVERLVAEIEKQGG